MELLFNIIVCIFLVIPLVIVIFLLICSLGSIIIVSCAVISEFFKDVGILGRILACILILFSFMLCWRLTNDRDAPRPAVKIAENYFQECNGNNLYVYKYKDRLAVEPSDIQVVANDASCTGEK